MEWFLENLVITPEHRKSASDFSKRKLRILGGNNPFSLLATEILHEIVLFLPQKDIHALALSGIVNYDVLCDSVLRKRKLLVDMPFLWDLPVLGDDRDGLKIYQDLKRHCFHTMARGHSFHGQYRGPGDNDIVLGLNNRRRIWNTCSIIAQEYLLAMDQSLCGQAEKASVFAKNCTTSVMPILDEAETPKHRRQTTFLLESLSDLEEQSIFTFLLQQDGKLCGITVQRSDKQKLLSVGQSTLPDHGRAYRALADRQNWLAAFEVV